MRATLPLTVAVIAILAAPVVGCAEVEPRGGAPMPLINSLGAPIGTVRAWQTSGGVAFRIEASGLPHGVHGLHVHGVGRCDPPGFTTAGAHWNPTGRKHGKDNPAGMHKGDLPNLLVGTDGRGSFEITIPDVHVDQLRAGDGSAVVIHAAPDDFRTDPSGNSGARIACGVLG